MSEPEVTEADREKAVTCGAKIWPSWADRWIRCGSPIGRDAKCLRYGHRRAAEESQ